MSDKNGRPTEQIAPLGHADQTYESCSGGRRSVPTPRRSHFIILVAGTLLLALFASGCSFNRAWQTAAATPAPPNGIQGRWQGTWTSEADGHTGKLRCLITQQDDGKYQARYHAKYRKIFSFGYTVTLEAQPADGGFKFTGEADLGWYAGGVYRYAGQAGPTNFSSTYQSKYDHGRFQMNRPE